MSETPSHPFARISVVASGATLKNGEMVGDFATIVGALASVVALAAAVQQVLVRSRRRNTEDELRQMIFRLLRLRRWLIAWIASVAQNRNAEASNGHLSFYAGAAQELEQHVAAIRAIDADGAVERLRADVEHAARCIHRQWDWAATMIPAGRLLTDLKHPHGLHAIERSKEIDLASEERQLVLLLRTIMWRLGNADEAEYIDEILPLDPDRHYDVDELWGNDVRPLD